MKSEEKIKKMLKHSVDTDGLVSPTAIQTLRWVLDIDGDYEFLWSIEDG